VNFDMWLNLTCMRTNVQAAVDHLVSCHDVQLPDLKRDRHVFSFADGIYLAPTDRFVRYGTPEHAALPTELVAAKHFEGLCFGREEDDVVIELEDPEDREDWYEAIKTPYMQSILDYQVTFSLLGRDPLWEAPLSEARRKNKSLTKISWRCFFALLAQEMGADVSRWMYVLIGRLIYEVGELDGWQVLPFLKGAASSGKSTILTRVCRGLYEAADVGTLSNNIERKFGLSALADKLIFIGPEIKSDIALEQVTFSLSQSESPPAAGGGRALSGEAKA